MKKEKNNLLLAALRGEEVDRPPVWMMRQAGRYLPDYQKLKKKYTFFERCQNPELAAEITLQPVEQIGVDAAILFSDILVVPQAMGMEVQMIKGKGPWMPQPIKSQTDYERLEFPDVEDRLHYVLDAIRLLKESLTEKVPLIGFAGAPWTLFCYMIQGKGSKSFDEARSFLYREPELSHLIFQKLTQVTIEYLSKQIEAGVDCVQLFDSWAGLLPPDLFDRFSLYYNQQILQALPSNCPSILFAKGAGNALDKMKDLAVALGVDWTIAPNRARQLTHCEVTLQGNLDPANLLAPTKEIKKKVHEMIQDFGKKKYIVNLGHGILPQTPVDHARAFVDAVKEYEGN